MRPNVDSPTARNSPSWAEDVTEVHPSAATPSRAWTPADDDLTSVQPSLTQPSFAPPSFTQTAVVGQAGVVPPAPAPGTPRGADIEIVEARRGEPRRRADPAPAQELSVIEARDISAWFGSHKVLERVSLTMPAGQVTALIGPSGCGKSTFLRILNRMHELVPSASLAGEVLLDGDDIYARGRKLQEARKHIGMVFQKPNPFPAMSIYDNVVSGLKLTGTRASRDEKDDIVERSLTAAGLWKEVKDRLRQPGGGLSGGQQQRLCIARGIAIKPEVLLLDEPCSALDPISTAKIEELIAELKNDYTVVIVTHNMQQAARCSDYTAYMYLGDLMEFGETEQMFFKPQRKETEDYITGRFG